MIHSYLKLRIIVLSSDDLTLFSYEILGLVGRSGASAHDLRQMVQRGRILAWAGESQYYSEPKRLARLGYLDARSEPGKTRARTVYSLTEKGVGAVREWARIPVAFTPVKSEMLTRMLVADLAGEQATRAGIVALRGEIEDLRARLEAQRASAGRLPHRREYLDLTTSFLGRLLDLHAEWIDEVEETLAGE